MMSTTTEANQDTGKRTLTSSQSSATSKASGPPTPGQGIGFAGVPYRASTTNKVKATNEAQDKESGYVSRLDPHTASGNGCANSSMLNPASHGPYSPSIYSPQSPAALSTTSFNLGWTTPAEIPAPLNARRSTETARFNPDNVSKPSYYELEKPYGGTKHFMMAHGLRYYDQGDCEIRREILEQLKNLEWQNRVNTAREEFARTGKVSVHLLSSEVADEYRREVEGVALRA